ncbi:hypothetical protein ACVWYI_002740 [Bradyrhizobium sp. LB13.1]
MDEIAEHGKHGPGEQDRDERPDGIAEQRLDPGGGEEIEGDIHAEHHEIAVGEVDDPHDAEDQAEPDTHQAVDGTDQKACGERLKESLHQPGLRAAPAPAC